ncbi:MAG: hypothetical protein A3C38_00745 [Planctomycetes bacterium RIFCSPHIGHO2_02_FULL_50_42]|nr:MAG: hypothetical protein A3C38_00745 [Planctomycetes bacterium RIFCSPHIGHO2_02_FULL_50_42]OHB92628.1 MAG: hypothetical protein A3E75_06150 [Planctomycetes bacterium RIFCSPHIGHO2_12_FULL_51_37]OHB94889.1 MAG: hypothetical protein A3I59_05195 [Planctomycetes bacterium RIFCSPLOWO2_02_FULL_50_16]OHC02573.1 MAG: hypothetical protein A3G17_07815 [Planctomycetes bacterium RIFCSPLOWO2_12_FULL_50_35]HCN19435.1 hypothetical protein [Planctomycetia bacterium]
MGKQELIEAYQKLSVLEPLQSSDDKLLRDLYKDFLERIITILILNKEKHYKLLLSGHTGCGKSTFLNILSDNSDIKEKFFVVPYSIKDVLDPDDIDHIDLILSMALQAVIRAHESHIKISTNLKERVRKIRDSLQEVMIEEQETIRRKKKEIGGGAGLGAIMKWLKLDFFASYQLNKEVRDSVRKRYKAEIRDLIDTTNTILSEIQSKLREKRILFLVDDTDKPPLRNAFEIFDDNGLHLARLNANIAFVIDMSVACSSRYRIITSKIGQGEPFPSIKIAERDGSDSGYCKNNRDRLKALLGKRISNGLIEGKALGEAVESSGGIVREAVRILKLAAEQCIVSDGKKIQETDVDSAVLKIRNEYSLNMKHVDLLKKVLDNPKWIPEQDEDIESADSPFLVLLHNLALMEYLNDERWRRPNPVLIKWLERM